MKQPVVMRPYEIMRAIHDLSPRAGSSEPDARTVMEMARVKGDWVNESFMREVMNAAVAMGLMCKVGKGTRGSPYRYYRPCLSAPYLPPPELTVFPGPQYLPVALTPAPAAPTFPEPFVGIAPPPSPVVEAAPKFTRIVEL